MPSTRSYLIVWAELVALATITLFASRALGGGWGLIVAAAIAVAKAALVVTRFMHLTRERPALRLVFAIAVGFVAILVLGVLADVGARDAASAYVDELGRP
jgi:caa(3)-type oxidase subunit IV